MDELLNNKIDKMNLIELHIHLDGALSVDNCRKIAKIQNIDIPKDDNEILNKMVAPTDCHDLNEFLTCFKFANSLLQTPIGIKNAIKNLQEELIAQGIIYAEIRFAPQLHTEVVSQEEIVKSAIEGLSLSKLKCNLILCCIRNDKNQEMNLEIVRIAKKYLGKGVCAIDLAGAEGIFKTKDFKYIFDYAKQLNVPYTIHAGEADGPISVFDAISFGAKRIGHGVRSFEDKELVNLIIEKGITLEICPTSNICTAIYKKISDMPIKEFLKSGVNITINTDDPTVCNTNLKKELKLIANIFNLSYDDIVKLELNAVEAAFINQNLKNELIERIKKSN